MQKYSSFNFYYKFKSLLTNSLRNYYLKSSFYNSKISKINKNNLIYKPSHNIMDCIVKFNKKKINIDQLDMDTIWKINNINDKNFKKLNSFYWIFSIDLKSSKEKTHSIIENWIDRNNEYNLKNWEIDTLSKRVISWIGNSKLTYEDSSEQYKNKLNFIIKKQINHLINEINGSEYFDDKILGCAAIILVGLSYKDNNYLDYGLKLLNKFINYSLDNEGFPKSRSLRQLIFYLKYLVFIRELLKETLSEIPEFLDEAIFYLGKAYSLIYQGNKQTYLFNGNNENNNKYLDIYLKENGYKFVNTSNEIGGYALLKNKKNTLIMDLGNSPDKKFSSNYQLGALSFELSYLDHKIICNSGYFQIQNHQLNDISRSTAAHSTLVIDNTSISNFRRNSLGIKNVERSFRILEKKVISRKDFWLMEGSHDGYVTKYGLIHKRSIKYDIKNCDLFGEDTITYKKNFRENNFEIRFHLHPMAKVTKTVDKKIILIDIGVSGWKFSCENFIADVENGLFFGKKNSYEENKNIVIFGRTKSKIQKISWKIEKI